MASSHFPRLHLSEHNDVFDSFDRMSELPDSLILSILSFLRLTRDAVRTTILSKRWKDLWTTVPCLKLDDRNPEFISGVVSQWRGAKIVSLRLEFWRLSPTSSDVESWLLFAVEKQVEDLLAYANVPYCPPQSLYSCSSITTLHLNNCLLKIEGSVQLNQLETLSIIGPFSLWVDGINKILLGAPRLENMRLSIIEIDGNLNILSRSLKTLNIDEATIKGSGVITISAPNLLTLEIHAYIYNGARFLCDVPSLTEACFKEDCYLSEAWYQLLRSICHVKKVTLLLYII